MNTGRVLKKERRSLCNFLGGNGRKDKNLTIFDKIGIFSIFCQTIQAKFGDPCDYYKSEKKFGHL